MSEQETSDVDTGLRVAMTAQPSDTTCGPTCLHAIYHFHQREVSLQSIIDEVPMFAEGGTLAVHLGCHALRMGFTTTLYSYNLRIFDPSWFDLSMAELDEKLKARQQLHPGGKKRREALMAYRQFIALGGRIRFSDLSPSLIRSYLSNGLPILAGLSSTWLYRSQREIPETCADDDINGEPVGHFVVLAGYDKVSRLVKIADPHGVNPLASQQYYSVPLERLITSLLLGVLTYDANLLILQPQT